MTDPAIKSLPADYQRAVARAIRRRAHVDRLARRAALVAHAREQFPGLPTLRSAAGCLYRTVGATPAVARVVLGI